MAPMAKALNLSRRIIGPLVYREIAGVMWKSFVGLTERPLRGSSHRSRIKDTE